MLELMTEWTRFLQKEMKIMVSSLADYVCPPATQDLELNTKNRDAAIKADHINEGVGLHITNRNVKIYTDNKLIKEINL